jgi:hypothetical protein
MNDTSCLITNDVETTSILNHKLRDKTGEYVLKQGMPRLLELYAKYDVQATFFFTGYIAKLYPDVVRMVLPYGHEVGSHGLSHALDQTFDTLSLKEQITNLSQSKAILEDISGQEVISFRAPAARVNYDLPKALEEAGYTIDSSVASQRLDMMFSFGSLKKLNWILAPRLPYFAQRDNIFKKGNSSVFEIPISAFGLPYIGTFMRIAPTLNRLNRWLLYLESRMTGRHFNFLTHPNEYIDEDFDGNPISRRAKNIVSYYLGDVLRHKLKVKNLGSRGLPLLENELIFFKKHQYKFVTCKALLEQHSNNNPRE